MCVRACIHFNRTIVLYWMCRYGPLVRHWTMRYEAKHNHLKKLAQNISISNFINITWTLAFHHQHWQCYKWQEGDVMDDELEIGPGTCTIVSQVSAHGRSNVIHALYLGHMGFVTCTRKWCFNSVAPLMCSTLHYYCSTVVCTCIQYYTYLAQKRDSVILWCTYNISFCRWFGGLQE